MLNINDTAHWITRSDLNLALKFLLCLDIIMNPLFHTDFSISDSLKNFRKSVLIYETIIELTISGWKTQNILEYAGKNNKGK